MVEAGNVGHDGFLIWLGGVHDVWGRAARCILTKTREENELSPLASHAEKPLGMVVMETSTHQLPATPSPESFSSLKPSLVTLGPGNLPLHGLSKA